MEEEETPALEVMGQPKSSDDEVVAFCLDCANPIPDIMAEKSRFLQTGSGPGVCPFCGGPMVPAYRSAIAGLKKKRRDGRGGRLI